MRQRAASTIAGRMLTATCLVCVGILAVAYVNAQGLDVVYVPTPRETVDRMLQVTEVGAADYVIDLGSGDGRIAIAAGRLGAKALGVDLDPARIRDAELNAKRAGVTDRVTFRQQNLFETDLTPATVLTMYLLPGINVKLRPTILAPAPGHARGVARLHHGRLEVRPHRDHQLAHPYVDRAGARRRQMAGARRQPELRYYDRPDLSGVPRHRERGRPHADAAQHQAARRHRSSSPSISTDRRQRCAASSMATACRDAAAAAASGAPPASGPIPTFALVTRKQEWPDRSGHSSQCA